MDLEEENFYEGIELLREGQISRISRSKGIPTKQEAASYELFKELGRFSEFSDEDVRRSIQNDYIRMDSLKIMNMKALAATVVFLSKYPVEPEYFKDEYILPIIEIVLPTIKGKEKQRLVIRYKAQILRYIRAIAIYDPSLINQ